MNDHVEIRISQSQVGNLNLGTIIGDIQNNLEAVAGTSAEDIVEALAGLSQAIVDDEGLPTDSKEELLEQVRHLSEAATEPEEKRSKGVLRAVMDAIKQGLEFATTAGKAWATWGPVIGTYFGT